MVARKGVACRLISVNIAWIIFSDIGGFHAAISRLWREKELHNMTNLISFPNLGWSFLVNRSPFSVFGFSIFWYSIFIIIGLTLGAVYILKTLPKQGIPKDDIYNMLLFGTIIAIICSRIYYIIFSPQAFTFRNLLAIRDGGLAIYGIVIGAALTVWGYCKWKKLDSKLVFDAMAIPLLFAQALGRWGNFTNAEAFGGPTTNIFAMTIENSGRMIAEMVHPTFFYESMWNLAGVGFLFFYKRYAKFKGELFLAYVAWYGIGRGFIEGLRADSLMLGNFRVSQWLAFLSAAAAIAVIAIARTRMKQKSE